jgi:hypothetical protein
MIAQMTPVAVVFERKDVALDLTRHREQLSIELRSSLL